MKMKKASHYEVWRRVFLGSLSLSDVSGMLSTMTAASTATQNCWERCCRACWAPWPLPRPPCRTAGRDAGEQLDACHASAHHACVDLGPPLFAGRALAATTAFLPRRCPEGGASAWGWRSSSKKGIDLAGRRLSFEILNFCGHFAKN
jgi:hypothetical protein